jgi:predicted DNA-binding transcriptional regulator AlpA
MKLRRHEVRMRYCNASDQTIDNWVARGKFPKPKRVIPGSRMVFWDSDELDALDAGEWSPGWQPPKPETVAA